MKKTDKLIMVVDDEPTMCRILDRILSSEGVDRQLKWDTKGATKTEHFGLGGTSS